MISMDQSSWNKKNFLILLATKMIGDFRETMVLDMWSMIINKNLGNLAAQTIKCKETGKGMLKP